MNKVKTCHFNFQFSCALVFKRRCLLIILSLSCAIVVQFWCCTFDWVTILENGRFLVCTDISSLSASPAHLYSGFSLMISIQHATKWWCHEFENIYYVSYTGFPWPITSSVCQQEFRRFRRKTSTARAQKKAIIFCRVRWNSFIKCEIPLSNVKFFYQMWKFPDQIWNSSYRYYFHEIVDKWIKSNRFYKNRTFWNSSYRYYFRKSNDNLFDGMNSVWIATGNKSNRFF